MNYTEIVGYLAAFCTTSAFLPQAIKAWRSKSTEDLSIVMIFLFNAGVILWLYYGWVIGSMPMIFANGCTLVLSMIILFFKLKHG